MALIEYLQRSIYMNLIYEDRYQLILSGLWVTLLLTISSFALGTILGMVFCAGKGSRNKVVRGISNGVTALMVKLPPLVLLMIFAYLILADTSFSAEAISIITFTLKCASHLSEMFRSAVDSVAVGEIEAARTLGYSKWQAFFPGRVSPGPPPGDAFVQDPVCADHAGHLRGEPSWRCRT